MKENKALLKAIHDEPADETVRLVYADWLEENGDKERPEFIRVQIELARLRGPRHDFARWDALRARERKILDKREARWRKKLPQFDGVGLEFARGFAEIVVPSSLAAFRDHAEALFTKLPVQEVQLPNLDDDDVLELARFAPLARFARLRLCNLLLDDNNLFALLGSPHLSGLRLLDLAGMALGPEPVRDLAANPALSNLEELDLNFNDVGTKGARAILLSPHLKKLKELLLRRNGVDRGSKTAKDLKKRLGKGLYL